VCSPRHYAHRRIRRGNAFDVPAWRRIHSQTPAKQRQKQFAVTADKCAAAGAQVVARLQQQHFPAVAQAHAEALAAIPQMAPITGCGHSEAFVSISFAAPPHDGLCDKQHGMALAYCAKTHAVPLSLAPAAECAMMLLPWRLRLPCVHGAWWQWRPHAYPHFLIPPAVPDPLHQRPCDAIWGCQLSSRTADGVLGSASPPPLIAEECELRTLRQTASFPALPADADLAAQVYKDMGLESF